MTTLNVFVAGASGAAGLPTVRELIERGHRVVAMTSTESKRGLLAGMGAEPAVVDAFDAGALTRAVAAARPDAVVNLLTRIPAMPLRASQFDATNELRTRGTANLLEAAVAAGAARFVSESFFTVYGLGPFERPRTEDDPVGRAGNGSSQPIIDAVASSEAQVRAATEQGRLEGVSLRFAGFHGPDAPSMAAMVEAVRRRRMPVIGATGSVISMVELSDAARAVAAAVEGGPPGIYNVADDEPVTMDAYLGEMARVLGARPPRHIPLGLMRLLAPYITSVVGSAAVPISNARITRELGWRPRFATYREVLAQLADGEAREAPQPPKRERSASTLAT
jgi:nucleoside-diphosphate-sugar epimerase